MLTIEYKRTGQRDGAPTFGVALPDGATDGGLTLRELIALTVREELAAFSERRLERTFAQVLTEARLAAGRAAGRIDSGQRHTAPPPSPDVAVGVAVEAFEDGLFFVLVDGRQQTELDAQVLVSSDSTVTFIRLVALSGG